MAGAIGLRGDYDAWALRAAAKRTKDRPQARRLLAPAAIYDGATRTERRRSAASAFTAASHPSVSANAQDRQITQRFRWQAADSFDDRREDDQACERRPRLRETEELREPVL